MVHGDIRAEGQGVPKCVLQPKADKKSDLEKVKGTVKAAVLQNDESCGDKMVMASFYDSKPVYFCTNACEAIVWIEKKRKVYSRQKKKMIYITFLRPSFVDQYNHGMNNVDIADQLRLVYRFDRWMRKRKWWWSMFFWGLELLIINAYVEYRKYHEMHDRKPPLEHFEFHQKIALAWLHPKAYWIKEKKRKRGVAGRTLIVDPDSASVSSLLNVTGPGPQTHTRTEQEQPGRKMTCRRVNDTLLEESLELNLIRLNGNHPHLPTQPMASGTRCQFHNWACGVQIKRQVTLCMTCNIALCLQCFAPFHLDKDLVPRRNQLVMENERQKKK